MELRKFISVLDRTGELVRIKQAVSAKLEAAAILDWVDRTSGKAVLFEKIAGHRSAVIGGLLASRSRLALAFGVEEERLLDAYVKGLRRRLKPRIVRAGPVMQVGIESGIDLRAQLPVLTHREGDAGPYMTSGVTIARDPETGATGMGIYRIQVRGRDQVALNIQNPPLADFLRKAERSGRDLEVAIVVGMDPLTFLASVSPAPPGVDRFEIAGGLHGKAIDLVKCRTVDVLVPAGAEFVLEGRIRCGVRVAEGPFGESWGTYQQGMNPVAKVTAIHHRRAPLYQALLSYSGEEPSLMGLITEAIAMQSLRDGGFRVSAIALDRCNRSNLIVQLRKKSDEEPRRLLELLLPQLPTVKTAVVVDDDIDPRDPHAVGFAIATRFQPKRGAVILDAQRATSLDPSAMTGPTGRVGSKLGMDATRPVAEPKRKFAMVRTSEGAAAQSRVLRRMRRGLYAGKLTS